MLQAWLVVCPPSWVAAVAVAQEHGALFFSGFGPVQGRGKMLLVQNSDIAPDECPASCGTFGSHCGQMTAK
ncbi:hypothetical protein M2368_003811 [Arthrobacter sp. JUb119]|nr:hypothetical protein [Arthrobacter sp. JUb119]TDU18041.1 hypothetical protein EDF61_1236 [Arthrobacter sp. JUb115]